MHELTDHFMEVLFSISNVSNLTYTRTIKNSELNFNGMSKSKSETEINYNNLKVFRRLESAISKVEQDPEYVKEMAKVSTFVPDDLLVDFKNDDPRTNDPAAWAAFGKQSTDFDIEAEEVMNKRIELYHQMKQKGSSDADIFKAILNFNNTLPVDYQVKAGLLKIDTKT